MRAVLGALLGLSTVTAGHAAPNLAGLQPHCKTQLSLARLALTHRGIPYRITSAFRSRAEQMRLYRRRGRNRYPVARPGRSAHERGLAVDISFGRARARAAQIMKACGWRQTVKSDPIHWECFHLARPQQCDHACLGPTPRTRHWVCPPAAPEEPLPGEGVSGEWDELAQQPAEGSHGDGGSD